MPTTDFQPMDIHTVTLMADLIRACQGNQRVTWAVDGDASRVVSGVARAICRDDNGNFMQPGVDVRNGFVWISSTFESFLPVHEVLELMSKHLFVVQTGI